MTGPTRDPADADDAWVLHRETLGAVPHTWADVEGDVMSTLVFGVGYQDLDPSTAGMTRLIAHLVHERIGAVAIPVGVDLTLSSTSFRATGSAEERASYLVRACRAVSSLDDLSDGELDVARRSVRAGVGLDGLYVHRNALSTRYGLDGPGVAAANDSRLMDWSADEVVALAQRWFHAGSAAVASSGRLPEGLELVLPPGRPMQRRPRPADQFVGPAWAGTGTPGLELGVTARLTDSPTVAMFAARVVRHALLARLRSERGLIHDVELAGVLVDPTTLHCNFDLDPAGPLDIDRSLVAMLDVLRELADGGPETEDLEIVRAQDLNALRSGWERREWLPWFTAHVLRGNAVPLLSSEGRDLRAISAQDVAAVVRDFAAHALVTVPHEHVPGPDASAALWSFGAHQLSPLVHEPAPATSDDVVTYPGKPSSGLRDAAFELRGDMIRVVGPSSVLTLPLADIVLAARDADGEIELVSRRGDVAWIDPSDYRGLKRAMPTILALLPAATSFSLAGKLDAPR